MGTVGACHVKSWRPVGVSGARYMLLDRSVALAVGRSYKVNDKHCEEIKITNTWLDDLTFEEAIIAQPKPLSDPTPSICHLYQRQLSSILGSILDDYFALAPRTTPYATYRRPWNLIKHSLLGGATLPPYFQLEDAGCSNGHYTAFSPLVSSLSSLHISLCTRDSAPTRCSSIDHGPVQIQPKHMLCVRMYASNLEAIISCREHGRAAHV